jgi:hypothetical protein
LLFCALRNIGLKHNLFGEAIVLSGGALKEILSPPPRRYQGKAGVGENLRQGMVHADASREFGAILGRRQGRKGFGYRAVDRPKIVDLPRLSKISILVEFDDAAGFFGVVLRRLPLVRINYKAAILIGHYETGQTATPDADVGQWGAFPINHLTG